MDWDRNQETKLYELLLTMTEEYGVTEFMTGGMGDFDTRFSEVVRKIKKKYDVKLVLVKPYDSDELGKNGAYYRAMFDFVVLPTELVGCHPKGAVIKRNKWMVDESDYVIVNVCRKYGGAYRTMQYALKQGKLLRNIAP